MTRIPLAIKQLHRAECHLARALRAIAARHHTDQDIAHLALDLAAWSDDHAYALAGHARTHHDVRMSARVRHVNPVHWLEERLSLALRHRPEPALLLLADLRRVHRIAAGASLDWELLAQGAQATKNQDLLALTSRCHPETLRQMRWANAMLKELAPQALAG